MRARNTLIGLIAAAVVAVVAWGAYATRSTTSTSASPTPTVSASQAASPSAVTVQGVAGQTALATLKASHKVETKTYTGLGEYVVSIDGVAGDATHYWSFNVNGKSSDVGAGSYTAKAGDSLEFVYTAQ